VPGDFHRDAPRHAGANQISYAGSSKVVRNQPHVFCTLPGTPRTRTRFTKFARARGAYDPSESNFHARRPPRLVQILNRLPAVRKNSLARRMLPIMHLSLDLNHFEEFPVERESARLVVLRRARFEPDFALDDVYLIPLNREYFSDSHAGVIHRDQYATRILRKRGAQLSVLIVVEKTLADVIFLCETDRRKYESHLAVFLPQIEHPSQRGKLAIDRRDRGAGRDPVARAFVARSLPAENRILARHRTVDVDCPLATEELRQMEYALPHAR
jgi:hypothetical protein